MYEESPKRILLVGATGYAGRKLANYLLTSTDATAILSGRNRTRLGDLQSSLPAVDLSRRTELLELHAANIDVNTLTNFDLLVNATGTGRHNAPMIQACLERRTARGVVMPEPQGRVDGHRSRPGVRLQLL